MTHSTVLKRLRTHVADGMVFYQKLRHYHWTVRGSLFFALHEKFEEFYLRWAEIVDDLAEHIVLRGGAAPASLQSMVELSKLREDTTVPAADVMVVNLAQDLEAMLDSMRRTIAIATEHDDAVAVNLLEGIRDEQTKHLWMLRAQIDDTSRKLLEDTSVV